MKVAINNLSVGLHNIDLGDFEAADIELKEPELYPNPIHIRVMIDKFDKAYRFKLQSKPMHCFTATGAWKTTYTGSKKR